MTGHSGVGHRERLRNRFEKNGFQGFHDYEILEFLLTFIFRQGDVKSTAKGLIKQFGSFSKALDASAEELASVPGMGKTSAVSLSAFRGIMAYYFQDYIVQQPEQLTKISALIEMLRASLAHKANEVLFALFLNAKNEVLSMRELGEGTVSQASAFPRKIVEEGLKLKATSLILAHNHPGGVAEPSEHDIAITKEIGNALKLVDISLQEHIILADSNYYSFMRNGFL